MPRYSEDQKKLLCEQLQAEARECMRTYGIRKTSLEDLANRVGIPKASFYLFFPSKEELQYHVIHEYMTSLYKRCHAQLAHAGSLTTEGFTQIIHKFFLEASDSFLVNIVKNNEYEYLLQKLPTDITEPKEKELEQIKRDLLLYLPEDQGDIFDDISSAMRLLFYGTALRNEVHTYSKALWRILFGISLQCLGRDLCDVS